MSMTTNSPSVVDDDAFTVTRTITIAAPLDKVWSAVAEPEHVSRWFGRLELDGAGPGATGTLSWTDGPRIPIRIEAVDEPHSISYRWGNDDASGAVSAELDLATSTVFTFTLVATDEGTELTVVETGFERTSDPAFNLAEHGKGWNGELDKLVALLEGEAG
ncbi:SRPBCC domain-containing protein [Microbacterium sp. HD4P20]|uniref:SRPBCC domain-containing protein n=1 Tax=Microbacterium sp. HD4P20 TaxID=2864874 RepID=UPI001C64464F|nr:SRPBCC domain-containing protein [Microbacterium sp. HD4P20]MCP2635341.1 SRPBCC domain-containing protein [Microbacterium sp. HD4P20]